MKLSVITICYNEKEIRRTCESIINQTWQDFEWIVVDGGSTDETLDILNEYKDRIDILISEKDNGIYNAMNKGINLTKGEWINFMNGGDTFYDHLALENVFKDKEYDASVLYGNLNLIPRNEIIKTADKIDLRFFGNSSVPHPSSFIKKSLFDKYGPYNENYKIVSDYEKFCIFFKNKETFLKVDHCIAHFDTKGISSNPKSKSKIAEEREDVKRNIFDSKEIKILNSQPLGKTIKNVIKAYFLFPWYIYKTYKIVSKR